MARNACTSTSIRQGTDSLQILRHKKGDVASAGPSSLRREVTLPDAIETAIPAKGEYHVVVDHVADCYSGSEYEKSPASFATTSTRASTKATSECDEFMEPELVSFDGLRLRNMHRTHSHYVTPVVTDVTKLKSTASASSFSTSHGGHVRSASNTPLSFASYDLDSASIGDTPTPTDYLGGGIMNFPPTLVGKLKRFTTLADLTEDENSPSHLMQAKSPLPTVIHNTGTPTKRATSPFFKTAAPSQGESPSSLQHKAVSRFVATGNTVPGMSSPLRPSL